MEVSALIRKVRWTADRVVGAKGKNRPAACLLRAFCMNAYTLLNRSTRPSTALFPSSHFSARRCPPSSAEPVHGWVQDFCGNTGLEDLGTTATLVSGLMCERRHPLRPSRAFWHCAIAFINGWMWPCSSAGSTRGNFLQP